MPARHDSRAKAGGKSRLLLAALAVEHDSRFKAERSFACVMTEQFARIRGMGLSEFLCLDHPGGSLLPVSCVRLQSSLEMPEARCGALRNRDVGER
jgi:hypothetical protein